MRSHPGLHSRMSLIETLTARVRGGRWVPIRSLNRRLLGGEGYVHDPSAAPDANAVEHWRVRSVILRGFHS